MGHLAYTRDTRQMRAYCEGVAQSEAGELQNTNPYVQAQEPELHAAWDTGWADHNGGNVDLSMCGVRVAGKPSPEVLNVRA